MLIENGLSIITVKKSELVAELTKNRAVHQALFIEALGGYQEAVVKELKAMLALAVEGKEYKKVVMLQEPQDHTKEYDRVIRMLGMSVKDEVQITETEFTQYVLDDWSWKAAFVGTASNYTKRG